MGVSLLTLPRRVIVLLVVTLLWVAADNFLEFIFPTYLENIGKSYSTIGILLSLPALVGMAIDLPLGHLSDRTSRKRTIIIGLLISVVASVVIFLVRGNLFLLVAFLAWGVGYQVWRVPRDAQFAALTEKERRAEYYGFDMQVKYIGQTVGPILGGVVLFAFGFFGGVSVYAVALGVAIAIILYFFAETDHRPFFHAVSRSARFDTLIAGVRGIWELGTFGMVLLFFSFLFTAWEQLLWTLQPLFYGPDVLNVPPYVGGLLLACFSLPGIFLSRRAGTFADQRGKRVFLLVGIVIMGVSLIFFSFAEHLFFIFLFALWIAVGWTLALPALHGLIIDLAHKQRKGKIAGAWDFAMDSDFFSGRLWAGLRRSGGGCA